MSTPPSSGSIPAEPPDPGEGESAVRKGLVVLGVLGALVAVVYLSPVREYLHHVHEISARIRQAGWPGAMIFIAGTALLVGSGMPRLVICPIAGMTFGFWQGLLYSQAGTLLGYYLLFLFIRWGGGQYLVRFVPRLKGLAGLMTQQGIPAVILARHFPIHGTVLNAILALTPVGHRDFLIGTVIGLLPEAVPCTLIGTGVGQASFRHAALYMGLAAVILAAVWIGFGLYFRSQKEAGMPEEKSG